MLAVLSIEHSVIHDTVVDISVRRRWHLRLLGVEHAFLQCAKDEWDVGWWRC